MTPELISADSTLLIESCKNEGFDSDLHTTTIIIKIFKVARSETRSRPMFGFSPP